MRYLILVIHNFFKKCKNSLTNCKNTLQIANYKWLIQTLKFYFEVGNPSHFKRVVGPSLAASLEPLAQCQNVASLSLLYRYYFGRCSFELAGLVPLPYS